MKGTDQLRWTSAGDTRAAILAGDLTACEVTEGALDRISELDEHVHAFLTVTAEHARAEARSLDERHAAGGAPGPLHGVPISLKDEVWTRGIRSTFGSKLYEGFIPEVDSEAVRRLRAAGAVVVGKTQLPEFASWPRSRNLVGDETQNPFDRSRISGASSSGSAASVAAGMVPLSLGSDGGGSIRIPAALNGAVGLFPTPGLISDRDSFSYSPFASLGPIGREVRDVATMLQVLAGHDPSNPSSLRGEAPDYLAGIEEGIAGLRIAFTADFGWIDVDPRIAAITSEAVQQLAGAGADVHLGGIEIDDIWPAFMALTRGAVELGGEHMVFTSTPGHLSRVTEDHALLIPPLQAAAEMGPLTRKEFATALEVIERVRRQMDELLRTYDVICSPTMATTAPPIPPDWEMPYRDERMGTNFTSMSNVCRQAALSYPVGLVEGLPVGLQIIGPSLSEALVLRVARALEQVRPFQEHPASLG